MYSADSWIVSLVWGRIGAAVLALAAFILASFGYAFSIKEQTALFDTVAGIFAGLAGFLALVSKIRESKKISE